MTMINMQCTLISANHCIVTQRLILENTLIHNTQSLYGRVRLTKERPRNVYWPEQGNASGQPATKRPSAGLCYWMATVNQTGAWQRPLAETLNTRLPAVVLEDGFSSWENASMSHWIHYTRCT